MTIEPAPAPEVVAAVMAALEVLREGESENEEPPLEQSRWRLAGLLGNQVPPAMNLEGSLWSYSDRERMA